MAILIDGIEPTQITYKDATKYLPQKNMRGVGLLWGIVRDFESEILELLEGGDYWQNARRYVGPLPSPGEDWVIAMQLIRKSFTPILKLREVWMRHVRGLVGREFLFETILEGMEEDRRKREKYQESRSDTEALADDADDVCGDVFDKRGEHKTVKKAVARLTATGKSYLRFDVPPGLLDEFVDTQTNETFFGLEVEDWQDGYRKTYLELCPAKSASIYIEPSTLQEFGFYSYAEKKGRKKVNCIQMSWIDEDEITQYRVLRSDNSKPDEWGIDTGGVLSLVEGDTDALLTPDLLQLQDIICAIGTSVKINSDVAGHPQLTFMDVEEPENGLETGPRTVQALYSSVATDKNGNPLLDNLGKPIIQQGRITYREPVSSQPLRDDIEFVSTEIYSAVNQRHIPARVSANASADMLVAMRADFADSLLETKPDVEKMLRQMFKGRLCMAASIANDVAVLEQFKAGRVRVDLKLNAGPLSVAEKQAIVDRWEKGLLSDETTMVLIGDADDVDAEMTKLKAQNLEQDRLNPAPVAKAALPTKEKVNA